MKRKLVAKIYRTRQFAISIIAVYAGGGDYGDDVVVGAYSFEGPDEKQFFLLVRDNVCIIAGDNRIIIFHRIIIKHYNKRVRNEMQYCC